MTEQMTAVVKFKGHGGLFIAGIPARDMTLGEWQEVSAELREKALQIGLYEVMEVNADEVSALAMEG